VDTPRFLISHAAAARYDVTTQRLASWARKGWIDRHPVGSVTYYEVAQLDALIYGRREHALPANVTPISEALVNADRTLGIGTATATASRTKKTAKRH
jgi:hypothetical protein